MDTKHTPGTKADAEARRVSQSADQRMKAIEQEHKRQREAERK
jgi:hypothetical protein